MAFLPSALPVCRKARRLSIQVTGRYVLCPICLMRRVFHLDVCDLHVLWLSGQTDFGAGMWHWPLEFGLWCSWSPCNHDRSVHEAQVTQIWPEFCLHCQQQAHDAVRELHLLKDVQPAKRHAVHSIKYFGQCVTTVTITRPICCLISASLFLSLYIHPILF